MKKLTIILFALLLKSYFSFAQTYQSSIYKSFTCDGTVGYWNPHWCDISGADRRTGSSKGSFLLATYTGADYSCHDGGLIPAGTPNFTISFWLKPLNLTGIIYKQYDAKPNAVQIELDNGKIKYSLADNSTYLKTYDTVITSPIIQLNKWQHIVIWHSNSNVKIYVDGVLTKSKTSVNLSKTIPYTGCSVDLGTVACYIDDINSTSRALNDAELQEMNTVDVNSNGGCTTLTPPTYNVKSYQWSTGETASTINVCKSGKYTLTFTDNQNVKSLLQYNFDISDINDSLWTPDAPVHAIYRKDNTIYLGGEFKNFRQTSGSAALLNTTTDKFDYGMPKVYGTINCIVSDGSGGYFIGGDFPSIGSYVISNLAHIKADKTVDQTFQPNPNKPVNSLVLANNKLYVGGEFTYIGGINMNYLAAYDLTTKLTTLWNPNPNGKVTSIAMINENLCVGGYFTTIGTLSRSYLAQVDTVYAQSTSWAPNPDSVIYKLVLNGNKLYVSGNFKNIAGTVMSKLCYFQNNTLMTWTPNPNGKVNDILEVGNNIYVGGSFTTIGGVNRKYIAAFSKTTGVLTSWSPTIDSTVYSLGYDANMLVCGGSFKNVNSTARNCIAGIDMTSGQLSSWNPDIRGVTGTFANVKTIYSNVGSIYAGGTFSSVGNISRNYLAAMDANSGALLPWAPEPNNIVRAIYATTSNVYVGGSFTTVNSGNTNRNYMAMFSASTANATGWNPNANADVYDIDVKGIYMYVAGKFTNIGSRTNNYLAQLDITYGQSSTWNFNMNGAVYDVSIKTDTLYVGGAFTSAAAQTRNKVCSFNTLNQTLTALNPNCNDTVWSVDTRSNILYLGGKFTQVSATARTFFASYNVTTNALDALTASYTNKEIKKVLTTPSVVYSGGTFANSKIQNANAYDAVNNIYSTVFNPYPNDEVKTMFVYKDKVYLGGKFTYSSGAFQPYFTAVNNLSVINAQVNPPFATTFCQGDIALTANLTANYMYQWYYNSTPIQGATSDTYFPAKTGVYNVLITDTINYGSSYSTGQAVTVTAAPDTNIIVTGPLSFCGTGSTKLQADATAGNTYKWFKNGSFLSGQIASSYTATGTGQYYCETTNTNSCKSTSQKININAASITPVITNQSGVTTVCSGTSVALSSDYATGNLWYKDGVSTSVTTQNYSATHSGKYKCFVTNGSCTGFSQEITITVNTLPSAPGVTNTFTYCQNTTAAQLAATGSNLLWYTDANTGTGNSVAPTPSTSNVGAVNYYVSQTTNSCESPRAQIGVTVNAIPSAPSATTSYIYCQGVSATQLSATGSNLLWYIVPTNGSGSSNAPTPSTSNAGTFRYYVSQAINTCESPRTEISVNVNSIPSLPSVTSTVAYCKDATASQLTATGNNLLWYTDANTGSGNSTAPTPSTASLGTVNYYVSQSSNNCESPRAQIAVSVNSIPSAPGVTSTVSYCQNATAPQLTATGSNLLWYIDANTGTGNSTAPTPSTASVSTQNYFVSQTTNGCESPRASIEVTVKSTPTAPSATTAYTYCQNITATQLSATGNSLLWYTDANTGTGSSNAPTPSTANAGTVYYFISQTLNACESPRTQIGVTTNALPSAPSVTTPVSYCKDASATQLTATGSNLLWYTDANTGTGSATAPTPSTTNVGTVNYYVSQASNNCESPRAQIALTTNAIPATPVVSQIGADLMSSIINGNQWYNLSGLIQGATQFVYTPSGAGYYYTIVTQNGCSSANSNIIHYVTTGIETLHDNTISIYPNPVANEVNIEMKGNTKLINLAILKITGEMVYSGTMLEKTTISTNLFASGIYILKLDNGNSVEFKKIVKE